MVRRSVVWAGLLVMVLVAACGDDDAVTATQPPAPTQAATTTTEAVQALQPGPVTSFEDIAGTYQRQGPGGQFFLHFFEDGTLHGSTNPDLIVDRPESVWQTRFEGTEIFITTDSSNCDQPDQGGTYELLVLENGNVEFAAVEEDTCATRSGTFQTEWAPVP